MVPMGHVRAQLCLHMYCSCCSTHEACARAHQPFWMGSSTKRRHLCALFHAIVHSKWVNSQLSVKVTKYRAQSCQLFAYRRIQPILIGRLWSITHQSGICCCYPSFRGPYFLSMPCCCWAYLHQNSINTLEYNLHWLQLRSGSAVLPTCPTFCHPHLTD